MATIMPKEKKMRDALQWVSDQTASGKDHKKALQEAVFKYNLDPKQEDYLYRLYAQENS
ncbi:MAG: hypothetical protein U5L00_13285 [Desulfovermiculus sp.]|nr:hypothetical protein [Desulfovermiculus sp.]